MFDNWDHTVQTGNDTEYSVVLLALCVGVLYSFARFVFARVLLHFVASSDFRSWAQKTFLSLPFNSILLLFSAISPPTRALRI
jgi:hypothetical protein